MLRNLPEGTRFHSTMALRRHAEAAENTGPAAPADPAQEALLDHMFWTSDRRLDAQQMNILYMLARNLIKWEKGKEPTFPIVGPAEWREKHKPRKKRTMWDVLREFGGT